MPETKKTPRRSLIHNIANDPSVSGQQTIHQDNVSEGPVPANVALERGDTGTTQSSSSVQGPSPLRKEVSGTPNSDTLDVWLSKREASRATGAEKSKNLQSRIRNFTDSTQFGVIVTSIIVLNAAYIGLKTELNTDDTNAQKVWFWSELCFIAIFTFELFLEVVCIRATVFQRFLECLRLFDRCNRHS